MQRREPQRRKDGLVNTGSWRTRAAAFGSVVAAVAVLTGCVDAANRAVGAGAAPTPTVTQTCQLTDISAIRENLTDRIAPASASALVRDALGGTDPLSFIARVTPVDLIAAGITPPQAAAGDSPVIMVVSHGDWTTDDLPISVGGGGQPAKASSADPVAAPAARVSWIVTLFPDQNSPATDVTYAPDDVCFRY